MENINNDDEKQLYKAILQLKTVDECFSFFRDLCTPEEVRAMKERWKLAQLLDDETNKLSYREIAAKTGASIATIGRVARFLKQENYRGYRLVLDRASKPKGENK